MSKGRYGKSHDIVDMLEIAAVKVIAYLIVYIRLIKGILRTLRLFLRRCPPSPG